jgi:hypothetical protein
VLTSRAVGGRRGEDGREQDPRGGELARYGSRPWQIASVCIA